MKSIISLVSTIYNGSNQAYIYIWVSKSERLLYVGQTNDKLGTLGRGHSHVHSKGTLRIRCSERIGLDLEQIQDLYLFSYALPQMQEFISIESSYRLGVEYLVQTKLYEQRSVANPIFQIISNVCTTERVNSGLVKDLATSIVSDFIHSYSRL